MHTILVIGSAGAGKSTFCLNIYDHLRVQSHNPVLVNLDPSQQTDSEYHFDIRDFITTQNVMESTDLGPNSSILMAFSLMIENLENMELEGYCIVDMPGQIEIFVHCESFIEIIKFLKTSGKCIIVNIFDCFNFTATEKFFSNCINQVICLSRCDLPFMTLVSKCDLFGIKEKKDDEHDQFSIVDNDHYQKNEQLSITNYNFQDQNKNVNNFIRNGNTLSFDDSKLKTKLEKDIYNFLQSNNILDFRIIDYDEEFFPDIVYEINMLLQYYEDIEFKETRE